MIIIIIKEKRKIHYEAEAITDVKCDNCGKSLVGDDEFIYKVETRSAYYVKDREFLSSSGFSDYSLDLCEDCIKPIEELLKNIESKTR